MERQSKPKRPVLRRTLIGCAATTAVLAALLVFLALTLSPGATDFDSPHHPYRSEEAKQEFLASYDARASKWPVPSTIVNCLCDWNSP